MPHCGEDGPAHDSQHSLLARQLVAGCEAQGQGPQNEKEKKQDFGKIEWGGFRKGGSSNSRFVLKPDVAIASEVSILSKSSLAITDFHTKKTQHVQLFKNLTPFLEPSPFAIPKESPPPPP